jgi:hypothetical protein
VEIQTDLFRDASAAAPVVVAYGGGLDSTAMLVEMVEAGSRVDLVLFADTGSEKPETYAYVEMFYGWLRDRGVRCEIVRYEPKRFKHWPPYATLDENCFTNGTLPSISFGRHSCSQKWKIEPQDAFLETWEPAVACWAAGGKVRKLIGYNAGKADGRRYAHAEGHQDPRFEYEYPLRVWGWDRPEEEERIVAAGLAVPVKSACFMCGAAKPFEIDMLPAAQLRRIVLMEARAAPRLRDVEGLWRKTVKGMRGATARPGKMTDYIRDKGLLPAAEIDEIIAVCPAALVAFQEMQADVPLHERADLKQWLALFDMRDASIFDTGTAHPFYHDVHLTGVTA